ncbi:MAG: AI-2E family transporter [Acidimicrobiia bacterium]|nr:AI-2E family transporter [Acidimicrobiia bacterium]
MSDRIRAAGSIAWSLVGLLLLLALVGLVAWVFRVIWPPLILAGVIVFLGNPTVTRLQRHNIPRAGGAIIIYLGFMAALVLVGVLVAPKVSRQTDGLATAWPDLQRDLEQRVNDVAEESREGSWPVQIPTYAELEEQFAPADAADTDEDGTISPAEQKDRLVGQFASARRVFGRIFHVGLIFVLAPVLALYLLIDLPNIRRVLRGLVPERNRGDVMVITRRLSVSLGGYVRGQLAVSFLVGMMASIGLLIIGLPYWLLVGMVAGIFNLIPLIGPWVGAVPAIAIALSTGGGTTQALLAALVMLIVQQIDNHLISPMVMQRAVKLHPTVVILALLAAGSLWGFVGMLIAVPAAAALKILVGQAWRRLALDEPLDEIEARWESDAESKVSGGFVERVGADVGPDPEPMGLI